MIEASAFAGFASGLIAAMQHGASFRAAATPEQLPDHNYLTYRRQMQATEKQSRLDDVYRQCGSTAVITLDGAIDRHISSMELSCYGGCDLADIDRALALADSEPAIKNIVLEFRSPGGGVIGIPETTALVAEIATRKNVIAFTDSQMCSAAYYIASAARQIVCTTSAWVGSIGVYCAILDASGWYEKEGLKFNFFKSGDFKGAGLDFKKLTPEEEKMFAERVNRLGTMFRDAVWTGRPNVGTTAMQGQSFMGEQALSLALVDKIVPGLEDVLARL